jgi:hypothetical protein
MSVASGGIPAGYRVEETDERVESMGKRFLRFRAQAFARKYPPSLPSYHLRVEKVGFLLYEVVAYQNRLVRI